MAKRFHARRRKRLFEALAVLDGRWCRACGRDENLEIDHKDGDPKNNDFSNLQLLCRACNRQGGVRRRWAGKSLNVRDQLGALEEKRAQEEGTARRAGSDAGDGLGAKGSSVDARRGESESQRGGDFRVEQEPEEGLGAKGSVHPKRLAPDSGSTQGGVTPSVPRVSVKAGQNCRDRRDSSSRATEKETMDPREAEIAEGVERAREKLAEAGIPFGWETTERNKCLFEWHRADPTGAASSVMERAFRAYAVARCARGPIEREELINAGAEVAGCSPLAAARYLAKLTSEEGSLERYLSEVGKPWVRLREGAGG